MYLLEAQKIVTSGQAEPYLSRFITAVQWAVTTGQPAPIDVDDAHVTATVLVRLLQTAECRKILKLGKRKNTRYKSRDFRAGTPQNDIARQYSKGQITRANAIENLASTFADAPDERTVARLLDDMAKDLDVELTTLDLELVALGADPAIPGSRNTAAKKLFELIAGPDWLAKIEKGIAASDDPEERKAKARADLAELLKGKLE